LYVFIPAPVDQNINEIKILLRFPSVISECGFNRYVMLSNLLFSHP